MSAENDPDRLQYYVPTRLLIEKYYPPGKNPNYTFLFEMIQQHGTLNWVSTSAQRLVHEAILDDMARRYKIENAKEIADDLLIVLEGRAQSSGLFAKNDGDD